MTFWWENPYLLIAVTAMEFGGYERRESWPEYQKFLKVANPSYKHPSFKLPKFEMCIGNGKYIPYLLGENDVGATDYVVVDHIIGTDGCKDDSE